MKACCEALQRDYNACDVNHAPTTCASRCCAERFLPDIRRPSETESSWGRISARLPWVLCRRPLPTYTENDATEAIVNENTPRAFIVAPVSTILFVAKTQLDDATCRNEPAHASNIPDGLNWTDLPAPGNIVIAQQPKADFSVALLGDIMTTRLVTRGLRGVIVDGRLRDISSCASIRAETGFHLWSKGISAAGPSLQLKPWAVDVPLEFGPTIVKAGDIACVDEEERSVCVIPRDLVTSVLALLPTLKEASLGVLEDVRKGASLVTAIARHPDFYSNYK